MSGKRPGTARGHNSRTRRSHTTYSKDHARAKGRAVSQGRYTPPRPTSKPSAWVLPLMVALIALGPVVIVTNYMGLLPGSPTSWYLLFGIASIGAGVFVASQYR